MQKQIELTEIRAVFQNNGQGVVYFSHAERIRDGARVYAAGEELRAGIRLEDFRDVALPVTLQNGEEIEFTGRDFEAYCVVLAAEMERQAAQRDRDNAEAAERERAEKERIASERQRLDAEERAAGDGAAADRAAIEERNRGKAARS